MGESFENPNFESVPESEPEVGEEEAVPATQEEVVENIEDSFEEEPSASEILEDEEMNVMALVEEAVPPEVREELAQETQEELPDSEETGFGQWLSAHPRLKKGIHAIALTTSLIAPMMKAEEAYAGSSRGTMNTIERVFRDGGRVLQGEGRSNERASRVEERIQARQDQLDIRHLKEKERLAAKNASQEERDLAETRHAQEQESLNRWAEKQRERDADTATRQRRDNAGRLIRGIVREVSR
jgi:hypothetical protein